MEYRGYEIQVLEYGIDGDDLYCVLENGKAVQGAVFDFVVLAQQWIDQQIAGKQKGFQNG